MNWTNAKNELLMKIEQFQDAYDFLLDNEIAFINNSNLMAKRDLLIDEAEKIQTVIDKATSAIDWVNRQFNAIKETSGLGLPFVIPGASFAVVMASTAAITKFLTDFNRLKALMYQNMIDNGVPPIEATKIISEIKNTEGVGSALTRVGLPLITGLVIIWTLKNAVKI